MRRVFGDTSFSLDGDGFFALGESEVEESLVFSRFGDVLTVELVQQFLSFSLSFETNESLLVEVIEDGTSGTDGVVVTAVFTLSIGSTAILGGFIVNQIEGILESLFAILGEMTSSSTPNEDGGREEVELLANLFSQLIFEISNFNSTVNEGSVEMQFDVSSNSGHLTLLGSISTFSSQNLGSVDNFLILGDDGNTLLLGFFGNSGADVVGITVQLTDAVFLQDNRENGTVLLSSEQEFL